MWLLSQPSSAAIATSTVAQKPTPPATPDPVVIERSKAEKPEPSVVEQVRDDVAVSEVARVQKALVELDRANVATDVAARNATTVQEALTRLRAEAEKGGISQHKALSQASELHARLYAKVKELQRESHLLHVHIETVVVPYLRSNLEGIRKKLETMLPDDGRRAAYEDLIREAAAQVSRVSTQSRLLGERVATLRTVARDVAHSRDLITLWRSMVLEAKTLGRKMESLNLKLSHIVSLLRPDA